MDNLIHSPRLLLVFLALSASLFGFVHWLFGLYKDHPSKGSGLLPHLEVSAEELGGFSYRALALISVLSLFLEMLMIRWISSEVRVFAYFKNLALVACFLGFGVGAYRCRRRVPVMALVAPILVLTVILKTPLSLLRQVMAGLPQMLGGATEVHMWGVPAVPTSWPSTLLALAIVVPLFAVIAMAFVPTGQLVGWYLEHAANGVTSYSVNVLASLAGIAGYTFLCFLYQPPAIWMAVVGVLAILVFWRKRQARWFLLASFIACVVMLTIPEHRDSSTYWSPYQKLGLTPSYDNGQLVSYQLTTNDTWYQRIVNLSPEFVQSHQDDFRDRPAQWAAYNMPYHFYNSPPSVLVLGSGMGNDVAAALRNGAGRVVAVEIDPLILKLGRELHFEHPYASTRTQVIVNDARNYIQNSKDHFDLIVFSLLDSHTTTSHFSNIRIDNFVYTREALERARQLLSPDGIFIVKFQAATPWVAGRLYSLMKTTFGEEPIQFETEKGGYDTSGRFFVAGSADRIKLAMGNLELAAFVRSHSGTSIQTARLTTDDWPYFYQHEPGLPIGVLLLSVAILLTFGWFLRQTNQSVRKVDLHFLLLGAGFMLLEAQIVSRMALLFGTTWVVNSIVVSGLLVLIVAANLVYQQFPGIPLRWAYSGLFVSLLVSLVVPPQRLFFESFSLRVAVSILGFGLPVLFAGIIFVSSFASAHFEGSALGSNLFGALAGGLLESLSLWFGLKSLIVLAALIYAGSALALLPARNAELVKPERIAA